MNYLDDIVKENYEKFSNINYESNKELHSKKYMNAFILPVKKHYNPYHTLWGTGGVLNENKEYIEESAQLGHNMSNRLYGKYKFNEKSIIVSNEKVIYLNFFFHHWGHYLLDVIR